MKGSRMGLSTLLLAATLACGCGGGGGSGSGGALSTSQPGPGGNQPGGPTSGTGQNPPQGTVKQQNAVALPSGFEDPRGIALNGSNMFVTAREIATQKAVILSMNGSNASVFARGDVPGTQNAMTNPVALAFSNGTLYVADLSSDFSPNATGAVLAVDPTGAITVLSAGTIDAPSGIAVLQDGSLAVCGLSTDDGMGTVFKITTAGATSILGKGGALTQPTGIGIDPNGTLFISDAGARLPQAQLVSLGSNGGTPALVSKITDSCAVEAGVASIGGQVFVSARQAGEGRISSVTGSSEQVGYTGGALVSPAGLTTNGTSLYVVDEDATGPGQILVLQ